MTRHEMISGLFVNLVEELEAALSDEALGAERFNNGDAQSGAAALQLACAVGRCKVYGVTLPEDLDGDLPPDVALAACQYGQEVAERMAERSRALPDLWDEAPSGVAEDLCLELLEVRHDLWCAGVAILDTYGRTLDEQRDIADRLNEAVDAFQEALARWDEALQAAETLDILATVSDSPLLENWRALLAEPYRAIPPWWLSSLGDRARRVHDSAEELFHQIHSAVGVAWRRTQPRSFHVLTVRRILQVPASPAVAAAQPNYELPIRELVQWRSPDGQYKAVLSLPASVKVDSMFCIEFRQRDDEPARNLAGHTARLCGLEFSINQDGLLCKEWHLLTESLQSLNPDSALVLEVDGIAWDFDQGTAEDLGE